MNITKKPNKLHSAIDIYWQFTDRKGWDVLNNSDKQDIMIWLDCRAD